MNFLWILELKIQISVQLSVVLRVSMVAIVRHLIHALVSNRNHEKIDLFSSETVLFSYR